MFTFIRMSRQKLNSNVTSVLTHLINARKKTYWTFTGMYIGILCSACNIQNQEIVNRKHTNLLIDETSPYLLQHAHNPVDWRPWSKSAFEKAKEENKLVIISIGYSACHWCHVMEHETFEDSTAAALMNEHYISIKVDREERPDVDQIYMTAVQLMTRQGGWPLNVVTLPDGRPVWGGTYFPKENWMAALQQIADLYKNDPEKMLEYAENLTEGVRQSELVEFNTAPAHFTKNDADTIFKEWKPSFDTDEGGPDRAPKFPVPNNYEYLLQYGVLGENLQALEHVQLTLKKMAFGGIYDQVGGGFARYSTDAEWRVPHFEKMLYDNAQLISLYSKAYQKFKDPLYAEIVSETLEWLDREMTGPDGEFYSALDADSEGEEGKFYVWSEEELREIIPANEWEEFTQYYDLQKGKWEGNIILMRKDNSQSGKAGEWNKTLLKKRAERIRPGLDDKSLTSWNAMMITALVDAAPLASLQEGISSPDGGGQEAAYITRATRNAEWLLNNQSRDDGSLYHSYKKGRSTIDGLIEDYAFSIQAFLKLFEATFDEKYLDQAEQWMEYARQNFEDTATGLFYTRSLKGEQLIAKSLETVDNVIPAANSVMAENLFLLSHYLDKPAYHEQAIHMLNQVNKERLLAYGENYSNWGQLLLRITYPHYEVAIAGKEAREKYLALQEHYLPNVVWIASETESELPLLQNRFVEGATKIYVCQDKACKLPVEKVEEAVELISDDRHSNLQH